MNDRFGLAGDVERGNPLAEWTEDDQSTPLCKCKIEEGSALLRNALPLSVVVQCKSSDDRRSKVDIQVEQTIWTGQQWAMGTAPSLAMLCLFYSSSLLSK